MKRIKLLSTNDIKNLTTQNKNIDIANYTIVSRETEKDLTILIFHELSKVRDNNRSLIILSNSFFELLINHLVKKELKTQSKILKDTRTYNYSVKLTLLYELNVIDKTEFDKLNILRRIRNNFSHEPFIELDLKDLNKINSISNEPYFILIFFIVETWNKHLNSFKDLINK